MWTERGGRREDNEHSREDSQKLGASGGPLGGAALPLSADWVRRKGGERGDILARGTRTAVDEAEREALARRAGVVKDERCVVCGGRERRGGSRGLETRDSTVVSIRCAVEARQWEDGTGVNLT